MKPRKFTVIELETDYYAILGLATNASFDEIKAARNAKAIENHPDMYSADMSSAIDAHHKMMLINEAFEILGSVEDRQKYDKFRAYNGEFTPNSFKSHDNSKQHTSQQNTTRDEHKGRTGSFGAESGTNEDWKHPPPPPTDGLGTDRYDYLGRQNTNMSEEDAMQARATGFAAFKAKVLAQKALGEEEKILDEGGRWAYHVGEI
ncbi:uncharacterized protein EAE98_008536 [Botrytis deweyae]|uniref:J domain-containing protein n=1 Tax=Botrytis deweyae TaxID=2478750 RepID=A0ABQ7IEH8_9HELO|nr:uncharacterized protein EAE98_008536 [Botrytis deweyae]KAF7921689.1 hypothetical protein EAE98_008536 [Botrytis deweyae]